MEPRDLRLLAALGARVIGRGDAGYPAGLLDLRDPPAFLTVRGMLPLGGIAVIGARDASERACSFAAELVVALGRPLVSGLARGVDAAAHRAALAAGLGQVAYVGTGLAETYPPEHAELAEEIVAHGGALASERLPAACATTWSLRRRDRLQAGHAAAVVLIESDERGGAMHTLAYARDCGRPRFALDCAAGGNRHALAEGAFALPWDVAAAAECVLSC